MVAYIKYLKWHLDNYLVSGRVVFDLKHHSLNYANYHVNITNCTNHRVTRFELCLPCAALSPVLRIELPKGVALINILVGMIRYPHCGVVGCGLSIHPYRAVLDFALIFNTLMKGLDHEFKAFLNTWTR